MTTFINIYDFSPMQAHQSLPALVSIVKAARAEEVQVRHKAWKSEQSTTIAHSCISLEEGHQKENVKHEPVSIVRRYYPQVVESVRNTGLSVGRSSQGLGTGRVV